MLKVLKFSRRSEILPALAVLLASMLSIAVAPSANAAIGQCGSLQSGDELRRGESLYSCDGQYQLAHQNDGNVAFYRVGGGALWDTRTGGRNTSVFVMQHDGNLVLYDGSNAVWDAGTAGNGGAFVALQEDGNMVIYRSPNELTALWARPADENTRPQDGTNCEPAFVVENYGGVQGSIGVVSAGHCDTPGKAAFGVSGNQDFEIVPLDVNKLSAPVVAGGQELRSANFFKAGSVNGDSFTSSDRAGMEANPKVIGANGPMVCRYGGVSGKRCGSITRDDYAPSYIAGAQGFYLLDIPCVKGDSGAAVVSMDGSRAVGIVSGRRRADGACIVSRLDQVFPGMKLYQPPALDARYQLLGLVGDKWYVLGAPAATRANCLRAAAEKRIEFRCVPA
ncbi:hypothetical protein ACTMSW_29500 [Micromonospora sp. BQ11]|uniref:hypothetical protein n=1 Tax=Micromonospora sp. BQ11 TaxID=3452212 RepID=UPI003F8A7577